jgi:hypothetical protein
MRRKVVVTVLIALAILAVLVATTWDRALAWAFTRDLTEKEARAGLSELGGRGPSVLPASAKITRGACLAGRDDTYFYELQLAPQDTPRFRSDVIEWLKLRRPGQFSDADDFIATPSPRSRPSWWDPKALPDADVLNGLDWVFAISHKSGIVLAVKYEM